MSYTPLPLHLEVIHEYDTSTIEEDASSMLSDATQHAGYVPYRPPNTTPEATNEVAFTIECSPVLSSPTRLPTPPKLLPIIWPGVYPSRTPSNPSRTPSKALSRISSHELSQPLSERPGLHLLSRTPSAAPSRTPSQSLSLRLFNFQIPHINTNVGPYSEALPWANSTHFRSTSDGAQEWSGLIESGEPPWKRYHRGPRHLRQPWFDGFLRRFPWRGASALFLVLLMTGASVAIILAANGTTPDLWKPAQPSVYLSILELLMMFSTLSALTEGIVVTIWVPLLRGTTIADLHDIYESTSPLSAMHRVLRLQTNKVAAATIMATCSLARGPLMQRALVLSTTEISPTATYSPATAFLAVATFLSIISTLSVIPLYGGYWIIGRDISLNPLEIARAFGAPLFDGVDGNVTARDIDMEKGGLTLRYGVVERSSYEKMLRVENTARVHVRSPKEGEIFG